MRIRLQELASSTPPLGSIGLIALIMTAAVGMTASAARGTARRTSSPEARRYVATTGSDSNPGTHARPFATVQRACDSLPSGGIVMIAAGTYSQGFDLDHCNPPTSITFSTYRRTNAFFAGDSTIRDTSNVRIQGDRVGHGVGLSLGMTTISGTTNAPTTNITWHDVNLYCKTGDPRWKLISSQLTKETACNSSLSINGAVTRFTWNGGDQEDWATCLTSCRTNRGSNPNGDLITTTDPSAIPSVITIEHIIVKNYFSIDNNGSKGDHSEGFVINTVSHLNFIDDSWTDCAPPATTGYALSNSCNTAYLFFGETGSSTPTANYVTFEGNIIAPGHGQASVAWDYDYPQGTEFHTTWLYNTIAGSFLIKGSDPNTSMAPGSVILTGRNMRFVGNVALKQAYAGCFAASYYSHNLWWSGSGVAARCGAGDVERSWVPETDIFTDPSAYNFHLLARSGGVDAGETRYCPAVDLYRTARPRHAACDIGAVEWDPATIIPGRRIGAVSLGMARSRVDALYGKPWHTAAIRFGRQRPKVLLETRRLHDAKLWIVYDHGLVVGIGTNSRYYATPSGLGAATKIAHAPDGFGWQRCKGRYMRSGGLAVTWLTTHGDARSGPIAALWIARRQLEDAPCS